MKNCVSDQKLHDVVNEIMKRKDLKQAQIFLLKHIDGKIELRYYGKDYYGKNVVFPDEIKSMDVTHCFKRISRMLIVGELKDKIKYFK